MQLRLPWASRPTPRENTEPEIIHKEIAPFGHRMQKEKETGIYRLAFQNINGISSTKRLVGEEELGEMMKLKIDVLGLIETNINWSLDAKSSFITAASLRFNKITRLAMSSSFTVKEGYWPGGTAMVTQGPVCGRVQQRGADKMGRFSWMALRGRRETGVIVITVYRVCQNCATRAGSDTAYMQQHTAMREAGIAAPDPRNMVLEDVSTLLAEWGQRGFHPLVMIDANAPWDETNFTRFNAQHGLVDIITDSHDGEAPSTYARGRNRIDYILGDTFVRRAAKYSGP